MGGVVDVGSNIDPFLAPYNEDATQGCGHVRNETYAGTPYLMNYKSPEEKLNAEEAAVKGESVDPEKAKGGDARTMYELALAAYNNARGQMANATYKVETQVREENINNIFDLYRKIKEGGDATASNHFKESNVDMSYETLTTMLLPAEVTELYRLKEKKYRDHETLSADEEIALNQLTLRENYKDYENLLQTKYDYVVESERQMRLEKAATLLQTEIDYRKEAAAKAKLAYENELNTGFAMDSVKLEEAVNAYMAAHDGVSEQDATAIIRQKQVAMYQLLADLKAKGGDAAIYNAYRDWFWRSSAFGDNVVGEFTSSGIAKIFDAMKNGVSDYWDIDFNLGANFYGYFTKMELASSLWGTDHATESELSTVKDYLETGGNLSDFTGFTSVYYNYFRSLQSLDISQTTYNTAEAVYGLSLLIVNQTMSLLRALGPMGLPMIPPTRYLQSMLQGRISSAFLTYMVDALNAVSLYGNAHSAAIVPANMDAIAAKQAEYNAALSDLNYFTKIDSVSELKDRLEGWGDNHKDPDGGGDLYKLTDTDLQYLFDQYKDGQPDFVDRDGNTIAATEKLQDNALDISNKQKEVKYYDTTGNRYDPTTLTDTKPDSYEGGYYVAHDGTNLQTRVEQHWSVSLQSGGAPYVEFVTITYDAGVKWVKIEETRNNGDRITRYAKLIIADGSEAYKNGSDAYSMEDVLPAMLQHGEALRQQAKAAYIAAGNAIKDQTLVLRERAHTQWNLFTTAGQTYDETDTDGKPTGNKITERTNGGMEFKGYTTTYADYAETATRIVEMSITQKKNVQMTEWNIREQELNAQIQRLGTQNEHHRKPWQPAMGSSHGQLPDGLEKLAKRDRPCRRKRKNRVGR